jgi:hypothetical protein
MRWMFCCVWLACCSLDTTALSDGSRGSGGSGGSGDTNDARKRDWAPRATASGRATAASDATDASAAQADASVVKASRGGAGGGSGGSARSMTSTPGSAMDAGQRSTDKGKPSSSTKAPEMDAATAAASDASTAAMLPSDANTPSPSAMDATTTEPVPPPDAPAADGGSDATQVDNLLVWFALTGTRSQRVLMAALIADLAGERPIDDEGMVSVLRSFDELQCRRNAPLCYQVCIWATSRCNICESWECRRLMYQHCGGDCRPDEETPAR